MVNTRSIDSQHELTVKTMLYIESPGQKLDTMMTTGGAIIAHIADTNIANGDKTPNGPPDQPNEPNPNLFL